MDTVQKKKILLFCCGGGGGHLSVAEAIVSYLPEYAIVIEHDPFFLYSPGGLSGTDIYNWLLRHNRKRLLNILYTIGWILLRINKKALHAFVQKRVEEEHPDLIISVIPFINEIAADNAKQKGIPFVLIPTDLNIDSFIRDITDKTSSSIIVCTSFSDKEQHQKLLNKGIDPSNIHITGFPLRSSFYEQKNKQSIKQRLGLTKDWPIVIIIMGATGSKAMIEYIEALQACTVECYIIACIGRNKTLATIIKSASFFSEKIHIFDDTYDISDTMALADLCITKPGSVTFCEAIYMHMPILLDHTSPVLIWERYNCTFLKQYTLGEVVTRLDTVAPLVDRYLTNKKKYATVRSQVSISFEQCNARLPIIISNALEQKGIAIMDYKKRPALALMICLMIVTPLIAISKQTKNFFTGIITNPRTVGAVMPSSCMVAQALIEPLRERRHPMRILELGSGTGQVTNAIIPLLQENDTLDLVELNQAYCKTLTELYGTQQNVHIFSGSVVDWKPTYQYDAIICTLPFNTFTPDLLEKCLEHICHLGKKDTLFCYIQLRFLKPFKWLLLNKTEWEENKIVTATMELFNKKYCYKQKNVYGNIPPVKVFYCRLP
jgi:UDP-N-acetylglucosamine:LPS N-acetylglucosamine transferase/phospholipid N-methyltransferase